jgi:hypothetical protein
MATGDKKVNMFVNRLMARADFDDRFLQYFESIVADTVAAFLQGKSGVFETAKITFTDDGSDKFKYVITTNKRIATGAGNVLTAKPALAEETEGIDFENANTIVYEVGVRYGQVEDDVSVNPRKGIPEYLTLRDVIGEVGPPDSVTDNAVNIQLFINALTDPVAGGHSFAGRLARVWMETPVSADPVLAFFEGTIQYDGGTQRNYIEIPYSGGNGPLGQDTSSDPPSTLAADYKVHVKGPSIRKGTNTIIKTDIVNYAFLVAITGAGTGNPAAYDTTDQQTVILITLDNAYDGPGAAGAGRIVNVDAGPVEWKYYNGEPFDPTNDLGMRHRDSDNDTFALVEGSIGRVARGARYASDFLETYQVAATAIPPWNEESKTGAGSAMSLTTTFAESGFLADVSGIMKVESDTATNDIYEAGAGLIWVKDRLPACYGRIAVQKINNSEAFFGMRQFSFSLERFGFVIISGAVKGRVKNGAGTPTDTATLKTVVAYEFIDVYAVVTSFTTIEFWVTGMGAPVSLTAPTAFNALPATGEAFQPYMKAHTIATPNNQALYADYVEFWTRGTGVKGAVQQ